MTASLPDEVQAVFDRFITTELTTVNRAGQPITWPVTPYYQPGEPCIDVTTGLGYPKKANDARANPLVALLFSDPTGCGLARPQPVRRFFSWYFTRIYIHIRPERVYVWPEGDPGTEPELYDCHVDEVRSGRS